jgi:hypothetical protein
MARQVKAFLAAGMVRPHRQFPGDPVVEVGAPEVQDLQAPRVARVAPAEQVIPGL